MNVFGNSRIAQCLLAAVVTAAALVSTTPCLAAIDRPVTWADMSTIDLRPVFQSQYASPTNLLEPAISDSAMDLVLRDADARVGQDFHIPAQMKDSVGFWLRIYTEFTTQHVVIFDERHPEIVYEVLDFRNLAKTARNRAAYEITVDRKVKSTVHAYRAAFRRLSQKKRKSSASPDPFETSILTAIRNTKHKHTFKELAKSLRTQTGQRDNIIKGLLAAETFFPKMERIFLNLGLPPEVTRLALVESSFNLHAVSRVGATGVWQFMRKSGLEYLTIDDKSGIDERLSPLKSTVAAAKLLKRNKRVLGSWPLAITSYNHGLRGLRIPADDAAKTGLGKLFNPCNGRRPRLGWASRNYYAEFLAVLHAEAYRHLYYGDAPLPPGHAVAFVQLTKAQTGLSLALEKGIALQEFRFFNPDIRNLRRKLPRGFWIAMPGESDDLAGFTSRKNPRPSDEG